MALGQGQCEQHRLPLDARGECELCRLSAMPSKAPGARRGVSWLIVAAAFVLVGGGVYGLQRVTDGQAPNPEVEGSVRGAVPAAPPRAVPEATANVQEPPPRPGPRDVPVPAMPDTLGGPEVRTAPAPASPPSGARAREFTEADAQSALRDVRIEMYATTWCGSCRRAREYLDFNGISYTEYDIDADADAKQRLSQINARGSIPTFQIDDIVQVGFSPENFEYRLNEAVRARLVAH